MRIRTANIIAALILLLLLNRSSFAQGFANLDFESAQITPTVGGSYVNEITVANALPDWDVLIGSSQQSQMVFNDPAVGSTFVNLWATNGQQISGNYSLLLQGGTTAPAASISQTALVPVSAESITFEAKELFAAAGSLVVSLGGQNLSYSAIAAGSDYTLYGAAIPAGLAGQTEQLEFSALEGGQNNWNLDNIVFSTSPVPEPGTLGLAAVGGVLLLSWRTRKNKS